MKEYSAFPKAPGLEPYHQMQFNVYLVCLEFLTLCRDTVGVLYNYSRLADIKIGLEYLKSYNCVYI